MNIRDTVEELTRVCMEIRHNIDATPDKNEREKIVLKHVKAYANKEHRINDFQTGLEWFNVAKPLSIKEHLAGKILVLDFFTYCCINCMHILPDLVALEKKFSIKDGLVVVGVHSAKFSNEQESRRLVSAVQRCGITHPVVNDYTLSMWRALGIACWPTLVMIGPSGKPLAVLVGEGHREELFLYVEVALAYFKSSDSISTNEIPLQLARHLLPAPSSNNVLLFPSKLEVFQSELGERLLVSDTGNNRILIMDTTGKVEHVIGGNNPDFRDGDFETARFNAPQGLCIDAKTLSIYVADTENHAIRKVDLRNKIVTTIAGTGCQGHDYVGGKIGKDQVLSSPWDVAVYNHDQGDKTVPVLFIAIAGTHQIWSVFLEDTVWWKNRKYKAGTCMAIVGSGKEENRNNTYPHAAGLAQPSGLVIARPIQAAFFADSESSSIRRVDLLDGRVSAVCGGNRDPMDLHDFGDVDGVQYDAKLQHPLGVSYHPFEEVLYVADTYNHKIKKVDPTTRRCTTICGDKRPNVNFTFDEPSGVAVSSNGEVLYVADTNNHAVKAVDLVTKNIVTISTNIPVMETDRVGGSSTANNTYNFDTSINSEGGQLSVTFDVTFLQSDLKLNLDAPQRWSIDTPRSAWGVAKAATGDITSPISIKVSEGSGTNELYITLDLVTCKTTECIPRRLSVVYRVHRNTSAPRSVTENRRLVVNK